MASLDESRDYIDGRKMVQPALPPSFSEEKNDRSDAGTGNGHRAETDPTHTQEPLSVDTDQVPTQVDLKAFDKSALPSIGMNGWPIDEEPTWIIPAIRVSRKPLRLKTGHSGAEDYISLIRNLIKNSGFYALSSVASPLVSLVLAPFLTHTLSHADYGALVVLNTIIALTAGVTQFGLSSAFLRAYSFEYESERDRMGVLSTVVVLLLLISIPITITAAITAPWLAELLFRNTSLSLPLRLAAMVILLLNLTVPGFAWLRAENRAVLFSTLSIANLLVSLAATLVLVGVLHMGIAGSLIAIGAGYGVVVVCTLPIILLRAGFRPRFDIARDLLSYGLPLVSNVVAVWVLQLSDRYLLSRFGSLAQTASYAVAYSLGSVLSVFVLNPFTLAWPAALFAIAKREDAAYVFQQVFRWYSMVLLFATFALSLLSIGVLDILFPPAYHSSAPIIPIVAASTMFYGVYTVFTVGVSISKKTWFAVLFTTTAALMNVGLNIFLIPHYGAMGAALSTFIAYAVLALIAYMVNRRIYPVPFEINIFIVALFIGMALYAGSDFLSQAQSIYGAWAIRICALILYGACLACLGWFFIWSHKKRRKSA